MSSCQMKDAIGSRGLIQEVIPTLLKKGSILVTQEEAKLLAFLKLF